MVDVLYNLLSTGDGLLLTQLLRKLDIFLKYITHISSVTQLGIQAKSSCLLDTEGSTKGNKEKQNHSVITGHE